MKIKFSRFIEIFWDTIKKSITSFINDNAIKLGSSLSYYTVFALPPLIVIIITVIGYFFGREAIQGEVYGQIKGLVGPVAAAQIQDTIQNIHLSRDTTMATIIGLITLFIGATGVFSEIQDSINTIWKIKVKPKKGIVKYILNRLISFSMIIVIGFLLLVSLIINTLMDVLSNRLQHYFSHVTVSVFYVLNIVLVFSVITTLFTIIFKVLPDGKVNWRDSLLGSSFTAVLFMLGKFAIGFYLGNSSVTNIYGAAGSIVLILLWVYYSSFILYYGAEFTKTYAMNYGSKIIPNNYAVQIEVKEVERKKPVNA